MPSQGPVASDRLTHPHPQRTRPPSRHWRLHRYRSSAPARVSPSAPESPRRRLAPMRYDNRWLRWLSSRAYPSSSLLPAGAIQDHGINARAPRLVPTLRVQPPSPASRRPRLQRLLDSYSCCWIAPSMLSLLTPLAIPACPNIPQLHPSRGTAVWNGHGQASPRADMGTLG